MSYLVKHLGFLKKKIMLGGELHYQWYHTVAVATLLD